jgi:rhamnopyranosyl-N-acetylglucosaminyl-diphospho-decaprenol beta-1,3/1,4-galactofuranosyltransferase
MRVLAHIHTMNDEAVIEQALEALRRQTRQPDAILIVDNASRDGTLNRVFPDSVTVIRNAENLGTSGTIRIGFDHALKHGFDWTWVFDADTVPEPRALENLLGFFERLTPEKRQRVCFLTGWPLTTAGSVKQPAISLEAARLQFIPLQADREFTACDCMLWSGSLFRMAAVAQIGLPSEDYVLDIAEIEYGYRARRLGFASYVVRNASIRHDVGRPPGAPARLYRLGPIRITATETPPIRTYYSVRNMLYFWLYQHKPRRIAWPLRWVTLRAVLTTLDFMARPRQRGPQFRACFRGIWHGVTGNLAARY